MFGGLLVGELSSGTKETACLYLQSQISSSLCGFLHRITVSVSACPLWPTGPTSGKSYLTAHHAERKAKDETDWCCTHTHTHTHTSSSSSSSSSLCVALGQEAAQSVSQMETPESLAFPRHSADCVCQHEQRAPWGHGRVGLTTPVGSFQPLWLVVSVARERHQNRRAW